MAANYTYCIVDDEPIARRIVKGYMEPIHLYSLKAEFGNAFDALVYLKQQQVDLLFLDIKMPGLNGLDFLRSIANPPKVIIISAFREFALEGFELNVVDYLLKPVSQTRFLQALQKFELGVTHITEARNTNHTEFMLIKADRKYVKLWFINLLFVEAKGDYVEYVLEDGVHRSKTTIAHVFEQLPDYFVQTHRSFIVNTKFVNAFSTEEVMLASHTIPIGRKHKESTLEKLKS